MIILGCLNLCWMPCLWAKGIIAIGQKEEALSGLSEPSKTVCTKILAPLSFSDQEIFLVNMISFDLESKKKFIKLLNSLGPKIVLQAFTFIWPENAKALIRNISELGKTEQKKVLELIASMENDLQMLHDVIGLLNDLRNRRSVLALVNRLSTGQRSDWLELINRLKNMIDPH